MQQRTPLNATQVNYMSTYFANLKNNGIYVALP